MRKGMWGGGLAVSLLALVLLSACSGAVQSSSGNSPKTYPWVTSNTIKVGAITPLTGPLAVQGIPETNGDKAFFDYINQTKGGVGGRKIQLVTADSQFDNQVAVQEFSGVAGQSAMLTQLFGTPITSALKSSIDQEKIIAQPASYGSQFYSDPYLAMFGAPYPIQIANLFDWAMSHGNRGNGKWAIVYRDDALGQDQLLGFDAAAKHYGIKDVLRVSYEPTASDFSGQIQQLVQFGASNVILATTADVAPRIVVGTVSAGYKPTWMGSTPIWNPVLGKNSQFMQAISSANYLVASPLPSFDSSNPGIVQARKELPKYMPNQSPDPYFTAGWLESYFTWKVLQQASKNKDFSRGGMLKAERQVGSTDFDGLLLTPVDFGKPVGQRVSRTMEIDHVALANPGGLAQIGTITGPAARAYKMPGA